MATYKNKIRKEFFAKHSLKDARGPIEETHEHKWVLETTIEGNKLSESGCLIDFRDFDKSLDEIIASFQGKNFSNLDFFKNRSASTENIAEYVFFQLKPIMDKSGVVLTDITIWEDENHGATFSL